MKSSILFALCLVFFACCAHADTLSDKDAAVKLSQKVIDHIEDGQLVKGFMTLRPHLNLPAPEFEKMKSNYLQSIPALEKVYGKTVRMELLKTEDRAEDSLLIVYRQRMAKSSVLWKFNFRKDNQRWVLAPFT